MFGIVFGADQLSEFFAVNCSGSFRSIVTPMGMRFLGSSAGAGCCASSLSCASAASRVVAMLVRTRAMPLSFPASEVRPV